MTDSHDSASPDLSPDPAPDEATSAATTDRRSSRTRAVIAGFVGVVAIIGLFATTVTVWAKGVLFDSDKVAAIVDDAMQEPEVNAAMATYLTDQLFVIVDVSGRVDAVLPAPLTALEPAIVGGAHSFVETRLQTLLAKDEVRQVITRVVRTAHAAMMKLLEGDGFGRAVTVTDGEVTINLLPLISRGLLAVQGLGLFDNVEIPTLTPDGDPAEQITELESAFGRDLPDDFAQLVVFQSQALADAGQTVNSAQQVMANVKRASWLIVGLTVVLLVATIVIAQRRRRAIVILALAGVAVMLLARMLVQRVVEKAPTLVIDPGARAAVASAVTQLSTGLIRLTTVVVVIGLITALIAFVTGPSERAVSLRRRAGASNTTFRAFVAAHRDGVAAAGFGGAVLVLFLLGISLGSLLVALAFAVLGGWALWGTQPAPAGE